MPKVRVFYDANGKVVEIEQRVDETYTPENITRAEMIGIATLVVDSERLQDIPFEELEVRDGQIQRARCRRARTVEEQRTVRVQEILAMDKSRLSDKEWLTLFREYMTLTGGF